MFFPFYQSKKSDLWSNTPIYLALHLIDTSNTTQEPLLSSCSKLIKLTSTHIALFVTISCSVLYTYDRHHSNWYTYFIIIYLELCLKIGIIICFFFFRLRTKVSFPVICNKYSNTLSIGLCWFTRKVLQTPMKVNLEKRYIVFTFLTHFAI